MKLMKAFILLLTCTLFWGQVVVAAEPAQMEAMPAAVSMADHGCDDSCSAMADPCESSGCDAESCAMTHACHNLMSPLYMPSSAMLSRLNLPLRVSGPVSGYRYLALVAIDYPPKASPA